MKKTLLLSLIGIFSISAVHAASSANTSSDVDCITEELLKHWENPKWHPNLSVTEKFWKCLEQYQNIYANDKKNPRSRSAGLYRIKLTPRIHWDYAANFIIQDKNPNKNEPDIFNGINLDEIKNQYQFDVNTGDIMPKQSEKNKTIETINKFKLDTTNVPELLLKKHKE